MALATRCRVSSLVSEISEVQDACSPNEIADEVFERYSNWVFNSRRPNGQEFIDDVLLALLAKVKVLELLIAIEGIDLVDQEAIDLGSIKNLPGRSQTSRRNAAGGILSSD